MPVYGQDQKVKIHVSGVLWAFTKDYTVDASILEKIFSHTLILGSVANS